jgi:putative PEP-CTERM system histidine kinase
VNTIGAFGYAAVGALYALLTVLLLTTGRRHRIGAYLIFASIVSAVWGFCLAAQTAFGSIHPLLIAFVEVSRATAWILFLVRLVSQIGVSRLLSSLSVVTCLIVAGGIIYTAVRGAAAPTLTVELDVVIIPGGLAIALFGLVLIEQLYRNSSVESRWSLNPLVLGVGGIFAYDLFLYSQGMLLNEIDLATWTARGLVSLFFVPMIAIAARRNTEWDVRIFISRQVVFYSTSLVAVGIYLLLMSLGGYALLIYGGTWGSLASIVFFIGAGLVLVIMLFSSTLRARLKVFLSKHFFRNKYDHREEWLRLISALSGFEGRSTRHIVIKALAQIVNSPSGILWVLADKEHSYQVAATFEAPGAAPNIPVSDPLIDFIKEEGWLIDLQEYALDPKHYQDLRLPCWLADDAEAWLIVPLVTRQELVGLIMLTKAPGPPTLNYEDRDLLKTAGNHIAVHLAQEKSDNLLAEAQQFEAYNRLTAFLMHDLNNLIAQQSLIVENAEKHKRKPEFVDDAISTIAGSVERMKRVMRQLKTGGSESPAKLTELKFIVSAAVDRCSAKKPVPTLNLNRVDARVAVDAEEFTMVLAHLVGNAQDACNQRGAVEVSLHQSDGTATVTVSDTGVGMSADFVRNRLFRPFDSTKGSQGMGIGAYQAREFARKMGSELQVRSEPGKGTSVSMTIPVHR